MKYLYNTYKSLLIVALSLLLGGTVLIAQEVNCMDGLDDDGDMLTDCFDPDCPSCDFDCEYKVPASGSGDITLMTANTGSDPDYMEAFVLVDSTGTIIYMTTTDPPTFTGVVPGRYLALVLVYQTDAGIKDLAVGNDINLVHSECFAMSDSYPFEVCLNEPPTLMNTGSAFPQCFCGGDMVIDESIMANDPDEDSLKATVTIDAGYIIGEDLLAYTGTIAVPTMFDAATGTLMIGPAPPSVIDYALKNVVYQNTSAAGAETPGPKTISYVVTDGYDTTSPVFTTIQVRGSTCSCQVILAAKNVSAVDNWVCDGTDNIHVTYSFVIANTGGMDLGLISLEENVASQLGAAFVSVVSAPTITASTATVDPTVNGGYDGSSSTNLFDGISGELHTGENITVEVVVAVDITQISSTLSNQATATGTAIDEVGDPIIDGVGQPITATDLTDNGTSPFTNNGSGGTDDTTPLLFPDIGVTKAITSAAPTIGGNPEDYTLTYELIVENTGTTVLEDITLMDDLSMWGGALLSSPSPTVSLINIDATTLPTGNNGGYNGVGEVNLLTAGGSGLLNPGESFKVLATVVVDKSQAPLAGLQNSAMTEAVPTDGAGTPLAGLDNPVDASDDATGLAVGDPACKNIGALNDSGGADDPTIVTFPPCPVLTKTIPTAPVEMPNGNYAVTYNFVIENVGGAPMCNLDLTEDFATELGCAFQDIISTTPIVLTNTSGNSISPTENIAYDGTSTNDNLFNTDGCLFPGDEIQVAVTVELDVSCEGVDDPLLNTATVSGTDPNTGMTVEDDSDSAPTGGPDDPTPLSIPNIDVSKDQISATLLANGNYEIEYHLMIQNTGNTVLSNVALEDDIATQFSPAFVSAMALTISGDAFVLGGVNTGFSGAGTTASLAIDGDDILDRTTVMRPGEMVLVTIKVEIDPALVPPTGLTNQATVTGTDPNGDPVTDVSDDGTDPTDDTDEPTPLDLGPIPALEKTLVAAPTPLGNGNFEATYVYNLKNNGTEEFCSIDAIDDFSSLFGCAFVDADPAVFIDFENNSGSSTAPTFNSLFDGRTQTNMFNGDGCLFPTDSIQWSVTVEITADCDPLPSPLANIATVVAEDPAGNPVEDDSDDESDLDGDGTPDNETGGEGDPTFTYLPAIEITKDLQNITALANGNYELEFKFNIENTGNADLSNINVTDPLPFTTAIIGTPVLAIMNTSATAMPADNNGSFDGAGDINMTIGAASDLLQPGESFMILMTVEVDPQAFGLLPQPVENQATVTADGPPGYPPVEDLSDDDSALPGSDDPTPVSIPPIPRLTKAISGTPTPLANGNYEVTYDFIIENVGSSEFCQIDLIEDFASQYDCAFVQVLNTTTPLLTNNTTNSTAPTLNTLYNGSTQTNLLGTDGCLFPSDLITLSVTIEVDISCPTRPEPLANQATVTGAGPEGEAVMDDSDDDTDLDGDNNPDNETGGEDDPTLLPIPEINVTKAFTSGMALPNDEYELNYEFIVENTGNVDLTNLSLLDPLVFGSTLTAAPMVSVMNISATSPPVANLAYDGIATTDLVIGMATDLLEPGQQYKVTLKVVVDIAAFAALPQPVENQATARGDDPNGNTVEDESDDASDVQNETGGTNDPTLVSVPQIKISKDVIDVQPATTEGNFYVTYELVVKNTGNVDLDSIQVSDDLAAEFGSAYVGLTAGPITSISSGSPTLPSSGSFPINVYDGVSGSLQPQDEITIQFTVEIDPDAGGAPSPLENQAMAAGKGPNGEDVTDLSDDSADPDDPDMDDPTPLSLPNIDLVKEITEIAPAASGSANHVDVTYQFVIENTGNVPLDSLSLIDDLATDMGAAFVQVVSLPTIDGSLSTATIPPTINPLFIGASPAVDLFLGMPTDQLLPNEQLVIEVVVELNPSAAGVDIPLVNNATAGGNDPDNTRVEAEAETPLDCQPAKLAISPDALTICEGEDVTLNATSDVAWTMYKWYNQNLSGVVSSEEQNPTFENILVTTDFVVTLCPTDGMCWTGLTDTITITVIPEAARPQVENVAVCEGELLQIATTTTVNSYQWSGPNGFTSIDQNPFVASEANLTDGGTYQLVVFNNDCPSDTASVTVTVHEMPAAPTLTSNGPICDGEDLVLSTSSVCDTFLWIGPDGSSTNTLLNPLLKTTTNTTTIPSTDVAYDAGIWTVVCINGTDCASEPSVDLEVVIHSIPTTPTPSYSGAVCEGNAITLLAGGSYPTSASFAWYDANPTPGPANLISSIENPTISDLAAGTYTYWLVVTVENCPSEAAPVTIVIHDTPLLTVSNGGTECVSPMTDINLSFNTTDGTGPYTFAWSGPNEFTSTAQLPVLPNASEELNGTYTLTITDANGCSASASTVVDITVGPDEPFLDGIGELCAGEPFVLSATTNYSGTDVEYIWVGPAGPYPDGPVLTIDATTTADGGMYTLQVVVDGCASIVSQPFNLSIVTPPDAPIVENVAICIGDLLQIGTETEAETYLWSGPNGFTSEDQNPFVTNVAELTDVGTYQLIVLQNSCPSEPAFVEVSIHSNEEPPTLRTNGPICEGEDLVLSTSATCETYIWIGPDGNSVATLSNPLLMTSINTTTIPPVDAAYDAGLWTLICQNGEGCESASSTPVEVVINEIPTAPLPTNNGPVCEGSEFQLIAGAAYPEGTIYTWYDEDPTGGASPITNLANPIILDVTTTGIYTYWLTVTINDCTSPAGQTNVTVNDLPTVSAINTATECVDPMTDLTIAALPAGGTVPYSYAWTGPNGFESIDSTATLPNAGNDLSGTYIVTLTDANGCTAQGETVIDATRGPDQPTINISDLACEGGEMKLTIPAYSGTDITYTWTTPADTNIIGWNTNQLIINPVSRADHEGAYSVKVEVNGCEIFSDTLDLQLLAKPTVAPTATDGTICTGGTLALFANAEGAVEYEWSGPNGFSATVANPVLNGVTFLDNGIYGITVTNSSGCTAIGEVPVNNILEEIPTASLVTNSPICEGDNLVLTSSTAGESFEWIGPLGASDLTLSSLSELTTEVGLTSIPPTSLAYLSGNWQVRVTDANGCISLSDPIAVTINEIPSAPLINNNTPVCFGETVSISASGDYPEGTIFNWYNGDPAAGGTLISNDKNPTFNNFTAAGNYFYWLTVTINGCTSTATPTLVVLREIPTVSAINSGTECVDPMTDVTVTALPEGGAAPYTYAWTGPNGFASIDSVATLPNAQDDLSGTYIVLITDANGCTATAETVIDVTSNPNRPNLVYSGVACEGESVLLNIQSFEGVEVNYNWFKDGVAFSNIGNQLVLNPVTIADRGDYHVEVAIDGCTTISDTLAVEVHAQPSVTIAMVANQACVDGSEELLLIALPEAGSGVYTYAWTGPNGFGSTDSIASLININASTSGTYTLTVTDDNGCVATTASQTVDVTNGLIEPTINVLDLSCDGGQIKLSIPAYRGTNIAYAWTTPSNKDVTGLNTNEIIISPVDSTIHNGNYSVVVEVDGCIIQSDTFFLQTLPAPLVSPSATADSICAGGLLNLFANATDAVQFSWAGPNNFVSSLPNPSISSVSVANNGPYAVTVTNSSGCTVVGLVTVDVILEENPTASIVSNSPICNGEDIVLSTSTEGIQFEWIGPLGASEQTLSTFIGLMTTTGTTTISPTTMAYKAGTYQVRITDVNGCTALSDEIEVVINEVPDAPLPVNSGPVCLGETVQLSAGATYPEGTIYNWYNTDPSLGGATVISTAANPVFNNWTTAGSYTYWLTITQENCTSVASQTEVIINPPPSVSAINSGMECVGPMTDLTVAAIPSGGTAPYTYIWTGPNGFASIDSAATLPNAASDLTGTYIVVLTDANGCTAISETVIDVTGSPNRPNLVFTGSECEGERIELGIQAFAGTSVRYSWYKDGVLLNSTNNQLILNPARTTDNGNYWVEVNVDDCTTRSDTLAVVVYQEPTVEIEMASERPCERGLDELNLIALPANGLYPYTYNWSGPNGFISTDSVATIVNITSAATGIYTLLITDANGCVSVMATRDIDVTDDFLEPQIDIASQACEGEEIILEVPSYQGVEVRYDWTIPSTVNVTGLNTNTLIVNPVDTALHQGDYSVVITIDDCVVQSDTFNLVTLGSPTVNPTIVSGTLCAGGILEMAANATNATTYEWSGPEGFTSALPNPRINEVSILNNGQYGVTVTNSSGCVAVGFIEVNVIEEKIEIPSFVTNSPICEGEDLVLSTSSVAARYEWIGPLGGSQQTLTTFPGLMTSTQSTTINAGNPAYLAGEWRVRIVDANGCEAISEPIEVVINDIPTALAFNNGPICKEGSIQLEAKEIEGANYEWRILNDTVLLSTNRTPTFDNIADTTIYELTVTVAGCVGQTATTQVTVWQPPTVAPSSTYDLNTDCAPSDVQLFANVILGSDSIVSYSWIGPNDFTSTLANPTIPNASAAVNGTYSLQVVDANGCMAFGATEILNVTDLQNAPFIIPSGPSCEGGQIELSIPAYSGSSVVYNWLKDGDILPNSDNPTLILNPVTLFDAGLYQVLIVVDGCTIESAPYELIIYDKPIATIAEMAAIGCVTGSEEANFDASVTGGVGPFEYVWTGPNNFEAFTEDPSLTNISAAMSGVYTLLVTDVNGCQSIAASVNLDITEGNHEPIITATAPTCKGGSVTISTKDEWASGVQFLWLKDGDTLHQIQTYEWTIFPVTAADAGVYQVQVTVDGCTNISDVYNLEIYTAPSISIAPIDAIACTSSFEDLTFDATVEGGRAPFTYDWSGPNGFTASIQDPDLINITDGTSGTYSVVVTDFNGCTAETSIAIDIKEGVPQPIIQTNGPVCEGSPLSLSINAYEGNRVTYNWTGPNGTSTANGDYPDAAFINILSADAANAGSYQVQVTIDGCTVNSAAINIDVYDNIAAVPTHSGGACDSDLQLFANVNLGNTSGLVFEWTGPNGFFSNVENPIIPNPTAINEGSYTVVISNTEGCPSHSFATEVGLVSNNPERPFIYYEGDICEGEQLVLSTIQLSGYQVDYEWTGPAGSTSSGAYPNNAYLLIENAKGQASGDYQVQIRVDGCQTFTSPVQSVIVNEIPSFTVTNNGSECIEPMDDIQLFALPGRVVEGLTFEWVGPNGFYSRSQNPILPNATDEYAGAYTVTVRNGSGCENSNSTTVDISRIPHQPLIASTGDICSGTVLTLSTTPYWGAEVIYEWTGPAGTTSSGAYPNAPELTLTPATFNLNGSYSLSVTVDGCSSMVSEAFAIDIASPPVIAITSDNISCAAPTSTLQLTTTIQGGIGPYEFEWTGPNGFTSTAANPVIANLSSEDAGTYTVFIRDASGCRSQVASQFIAVSTPPSTPELAIITPNICEGETAVFTADTYNGSSIFYHWTLQGDSAKVYTTTSPSLVLEEVPSWTSGFISVRVEVDGCTSANSGEMQFIVNPHPPTPSLATNFIVCEGEALELFTTTTADAYRWTGPNGFTSDLQYPISITEVGVRHAGTYTLVSRIDGCESDPVTTEVIVREKPAQPVLQLATDICEGENIVLQVLNPQPGFTYQWLTPSVMAQQFPSSPSLMGDTVLWTNLPWTIISKADYPHLYESGAWQVRLVNANGCSSIASIPRDLDIHEVPSLPLLSNTGPICEGESVEVRAGEVAGATYSWFKEVRLTDTTNTFKLVSKERNLEVNDLELGLHRYYLTVERNGCIVTSLPSSTIVSSTAIPEGTFTQVLVKQIPEVVLLPFSGNYCTGDDIILFAPAIFGASYAWTGPNGFQSVERTPRINNPTVANSGTYRLVVTTNGCASKETSTQVIVGEQPPVPTIAYEGPTCEGDDIRLTVPMAANAASVEYFWTGPNGFTSSEPAIILTNAQLDFAGDYTVELIVNGCLSQPSNPMPVVVNPVPSAPSITTNGSPATPLCEGETILLETDYRPTATYNWIGPAGFTSNSVNPIIENAQIVNSGTYSLSIIENGCASTVSTMEVSVQAAPGQPLAANTSPICSGTSFDLYVQNPVDGYRYEWFRQDGNAFVGEGATLTLDNVDIRDAGSYYVIASVGNCTSSVFTNSGFSNEVITEVIIDNPAKEVAHTAGYIYACESEVTLAATPPQLAAGTWSLADNNGSAIIIDPTNPNSIVTNLQTGPNAFVWTLASGNCTATSTDTLIVEYNIPPGATDDFFELDLNETQDLNLIANDQIQSGDINIYILTELRLGRVVRNGEGIYTYIPNENALGVETFRYQICHTECPDLCAEATATVVIGEGVECFAPELVTPNNDGFNDLFTVPCLAFYPGSSLTIYNRYGDEIYFSDDYQNDWDGTYNGNPLPAGTYYYILNINDPSGTQLSGYIFLQR